MYKGCLLLYSVYYIKYCLMNNHFNIKTKQKQKQKHPLLTLYTLHTLPFPIKTFWIRTQYLAFCSGCNSHTNITNVVCEANGA